MTSDVSARHVVCDAGPTKVRRKWKKGVTPYVLPSTSVALASLHAHPSNIQKISVNFVL